MAKDYFFCLDGPLDSMPADGQMRSANLSGITNLIQKAGGDPRVILEQHHIDPWLARDPDHYIECQSLVNLLEHCSEAFNDSIFGLHLAQLQQPDVYGCITALCRAAPTVKESIEKFIEFIPVVHSPNSVIELAEVDTSTEVRWHVTKSLGLNDQAKYQATMLNAKLLRQIGGHDFKITYINLSANIRSRDIPALEAGFGCRVYKTMTENAIAFPTEQLNWPVASANRLLFQLLGGYLNQVKVAARKTTAERVQDYVRGALPSGHCSIERCAEKLGMSVRTLQANLSMADKKFSDILEAQRMELAKTYLKLDQHSLDDISTNLGYSEQSSFGRAFKRWTGVTPKQFRHKYHSNAKST